MPYLVISLAVAFASLFLSYSLISTQRLFPDEAYYAWIAQRIIEDYSLIWSKEVTAYHPPGFALFLALATAGSVTILALKKTMFACYCAGLLAVGYASARIKDLFFASISLILLSTNYNYILYSHYITMDTLLVVLFIGLIGLLIKNDSALNRKDFGIALLGALAILLKWSAVLLIPFLCFYYFFAFDQLSVRQRLKKSCPALGALALALVFLCLNNYHISGSILPVSASIDRIFTVDRTILWFKVLIVLIQPVLLPFFALGCLALTKESRKMRSTLFGWLIVFSIGIYLFSDLNNRYSLLLLPATVLITSIGLVGMIRLLRKCRISQTAGKMIILLLTILIGALSLDSALVKLKEINRNSVGFRQAAEVILKIDTPATKILSVSPRQIRYFTGINYENFGGKIVWINAAHTPEKFEQYVQSLTSEAILVIDVWSTQRPQWCVFEKKDELFGLITYLEALEFKIVDIIEFDFSKGEGMVRSPVVLIFKRNIG